MGKEDIHHSFKTLVLEEPGLPIYKDRRYTFKEPVSRKTARDLVSNHIGHIIHSPQAPFSHSVEDNSGKKLSGYKPDPTSPGYKNVHDKASRKPPTHKD